MTKDAVEVFVKQSLMQIQEIENIKITWVIEFIEHPSDSIYPVTGRSGQVYGYAMLCPKRGTYCLRMSDQQFQECRHDIFGIGRRWYYPVPAIEIEVVKGEEAVKPPVPVVFPEAVKEQGDGKPVDHPKQEAESAQIAQVRKGFKKVTA